MRIAVDAMGGDLGPRPCVEGAVLAVQRFNIDVAIVGKERHLRRLLSTKMQNYPEHRIQIIDAEEVVEMTDNPRDSLRKRKSSLAIAVDMVKSGQADAVVSPTNTGAFLAHAQMKWRTLTGIKKPALAALLPTLHDRVVIIDGGAVMDAKPHQIVNFGIMGATYARVVLDRPNPRLGLLSIGEEESKGNEVTIASHKLLKKTGLNFIGNAEGRDIWTGDFDVVACDGFVGNIVLKEAEGLARMITDLMKREAKKSIPTSIGGVLMIPVVKAIKRKTDYDEAGGAPLLGVNGIAIVCHGSSNAKAIMNGIRVAAESHSRKLIHQLQADLDYHHENMEKEGVSHAVVTGEVEPDEDVEG